MNTSPMLVMTLALQLLAVPVFAQNNGNTPTMDALQQDAIELKRQLLTSTREEREAISEEADRLMTRFDRRISALNQNIRQGQQDMSEAAVRYSSDLLETLDEQRMELEQQLDELSDSSANAWDRAVYRFSSAYDAFYESWEDVELNFPMSDR